jgi:hypothetical protein
VQNMLLGLPTLVRVIKIKWFCYTLQ